MLFFFVFLMSRSCLFSYFSMYKQYKKEYFQKSVEELVVLVVRNGTTCKM